MISRLERKQQTHEEVLRAARRVVQRQGFAATTARDVAAEAQVAVGTVFLHFPTMGRLAETMLDETVGSALAAAQVDPPTGIVDRLVHVADCLFEAYGAEPELAQQVIAGSLFEGEPGGPADLRMTQLRDWVTAEVLAATERGEIPEIDPEQAFLGYFALYFGTLVGGLRGQLDRATQRSLLRATLTRLLGAGVAS